MGDIFNSIFKQTISDYLSHKECFYHIQHDWDKCSNQFSLILKEEMTKIYDNQNYVHFMQFCW